MYAGNMPDSVRDLIARKLKPDGKLIILACKQAAVESAANMKDLAKKIGHTVVANTGPVNNGNFGKGDWVEFPAPK
jgi:hypothetical protein